MELVWFGLQCFFSFWFLWTLDSICASYDCLSEISKRKFLIQCFRHLLATQLERISLEKDRMCRIHSPCVDVRCWNRKLGWDITILITFCWALEFCQILHLYIHWILVFLVHMHVDDSLKITYTNSCKTPFLVSWVLRSSYISLWGLEEPEGLKYQHNLPWGAPETDDVLCMSLLIQKVHFKRASRVTHALKQSLYNCASNAQHSAN